ncbi:membrane protein [Streptococcus pneumoniae]|nr:membrane protein [Streptococcus pneumoniae]
MIDKGRLEAFTDAIIAIAATIMVLELAAPNEVTITSLISQWSIFLAYVNSFAMIYIIWLNHYRSFKKASQISVKTFIINGIWLFFLTLVPFATSWVGKYPNDTLPELLYAVVLLLWSVMYQILDNQIVKDNPDSKIDSTNKLSLRIPMYCGYILAIILAFIKPVLCLIVILWILILITIHFLVVRKKK